jgi:hypothetical protein
MRMNIKKIVLFLSIISGLLFVSLAFALINGGLEPDQWYELSVQEENGKNLNWADMMHSMGWAILFSIVYMIGSTLVLFFKGKSLSNGRFILYYLFLLISTMLLASGLTVWLLPQSS